MMEFLIRQAEEKDIPGIMCVMREAETDHAHPDWFVSDDEAFVRKHLRDKGFVIAAEAPDGRIAGFFLVKYPQSEENLGNALNYTEEQLAKVAIMDSAAVASEFRGNGLQGRMLEEAERHLDTVRYPYLMCTVHPDNRYSLSNMQKHGYEIQITTECYGGLKRHILLKNCELYPKKIL